MTVIELVSEAAAPGPLPSVREHLSSDRTRSALRVQQVILQAARDYLAETGFTELLAPVVGPVTDPGCRGSKQVDIDYYGHRYKLMTSVILYKQASLLSFGKIFYIAPNVRLEPPETTSTARHLTEFHQLDVEIADASREEAMAVAEGIVTHAVRRVIERVSLHLDQLGRDRKPLADALTGPFDRISHDEAVRRLHERRHAQYHASEIDWVGEEILSGAAPRPFFVTDYPKGSRGFYDRESAAEPGKLRSFDLIAPEGYGELCSGSEREHEFRKLITRMRETGENPAKYRWYLDVVRNGIPPSAGFGIGIQRLTRYIAGLDAVWQASAFPKLPGTVSP
jgi:asparaginyl-tRNA synthetase